MRKDILLAASLAAFALGNTAFADDSVDDKLQNRIEARLKANKLTHVDVDVDKGVATLKGEVGTPSEKARAARLAKVKGVASVDNKIDVDADKAKSQVEDRADATKDRIDKNAKAQKEAIDRKAEATKDSAEKNAEAAKEAVDRKAEAGKNAVERKSETAKAHVDRTGEPPAPAAAKEPNKKFDPLITANVKMKFAADDLVKAHQINVDSERDGVVTLRGTVDSEAAHKRAVDIAKKTDGVRQVNDLLKVGPAK